MTETIDHEPTHTAAARRGGPLIVTEDTELLDDLLRLCAAAGATPEVLGADGATGTPLTADVPATSAAAGARDGPGRLGGRAARPRR
jgi:hypothetical protein